MGKATLATYSTEDVTALIRSRGLRKTTSKSIVRRGDLMAELERIRQNGYAVDDEEYAAGLRCIAAVVYNHQAEALCAISISGLAERLTGDRIPALGRLVSDTAREMTLALGGRTNASS
jgi:IclR family acetate operon transcriptional repressor